MGIDFAASVTALTQAEYAFLDALRGGEPAQKYAMRVGYSVAWAKWMSRKVRRKLGASTIAEALAMSEVTAEDLAAIRKELADLKAAQADLAAAKTPAAKAGAREDVREAKSDLDSELARRGLSKADLDKLQEDKEYEKFKGREERLRLEREEEEARRVATEGDDDVVDPPPAPSRKPKAEKPKEEAPQSAHFSERKLWGAKDAA